MNRTEELREIYEKSGLKDLLVDAEIKYVEKDDYTKLKFVPSDLGVSSIELWDLKSGGMYFRIHHRDTAPHWLSDSMQGWELRREGSASFGSNFDGDPMKPARLLADLLRSKK